MGYNGRSGNMADKLPITESYCIGCGRPYTLDKFYKSPNPLHYNGVLPYCKDCCNRMVHSYIKKYGNLESALWMSCANVGLPFTKRVFEALERKISEKDKIGKNFNYVGNYLQVMNTIRKNSDHWEEFADTDVSFGDIKNLQRHEESIKAEAEKFRLDWGYHEVEEYQFLEYRYEYYTDGLGELKPSQETLYRRLCLVELAIRKKDESGEDTKEEQKQLLQLMKALEIDDFKNTKDLSMAEKIIESQIAWMEEEEPAFHYKDLEKYKDFLGAESYWENHVKRPLRNLLIGSKEYTLKETHDEIASVTEKGGS